MQITEIRTFDPKFLYKCKHVEPDQKYRRSYKKTYYFNTLLYKTNNKIKFDPP